MVKPRLRLWHGKWMCMSLMVTGWGATPLIAWIDWKIEHDVFMRRLPLRESRHGRYV